MLYVRTIGHDSELEPERHEAILHYCKKLKLITKQNEKDICTISSIKDIVRFNLSQFLAKLDEPHKSLNYFDSEKGIMSIEAPKVYHINVVFRYALCQRQQKHQKIRDIELERIRIVLNKKGMLRVEEVVPRGEMGYQEQKYVH